MCTGGLDTDKNSCVQPILSFARSLPCTHKHKLATGLRCLEQHGYLCTQQASMHLLPPHSYYVSVYGFCKNMYACVHLHAFPAYICMDVSSCSLHLHAHVRKICNHACIHTSLHLCICTDKHTYTQTHIYLNVHPSLPTHLHTYSLISIHFSIHPSIHPSILTFTIL